jgi:hypothetical protein
MTDNSPINTENESAIKPQGRLPQGHPMNVGTELVTKGSEGANLEKRIITGEAKD